jgi:hypothetical protein
MFLCF